MIQSLQDVVSHFVSGDAGQRPPHNLPRSGSCQSAKDGIQVDFHDRQHSVLSTPGQPQSCAVARRRIKSKNQPDGVRAAGGELPAGQQSAELPPETVCNRCIQPHTVLDAQPRRLGCRWRNGEPKGHQQLCRSKSFHSPIINEIATNM